MVGAVARVRGRQMNLRTLYWRYVRPYRTWDRQHHRVWTGWPFALVRRLRGATFDASRPYWIASYRTTLPVGFERWLRRGDRPQRITIHGSVEAAASYEAQSLYRVAALSPRPSEGRDEYICDGYRVLEVVPTATGYGPRGQEVIERVKALKALPAELAGAMVDLLDPAAVEELQLRWDRERKGPSHNSLVGRDVYGAVFTWVIAKGDHFPGMTGKGSIRDPRWQALHRLAWLGIEALLCADGPDDQQVTPYVEAWDRVKAAASRDAVAERTLAG